MSMPIYWRPNVGRISPPASPPEDWVIGLGTDSDDDDDDDDDDMAPAVNPVRSDGDVCDAVEGDAPEAARKQGGWVGKNKRNTERKKGGWQSGTPREVDDDRAGGGGKKASNERGVKRSRGIFTGPFTHRGIFTHLPRTEEEALSGLIHLQNLTTSDEFHRRLFVETKRYRFLMVMMTHAASCRDSTSCAVWKCDSAKRHLRHARGCANPACADRICPHVKFLLHHRRECADGDGCCVCAAAREREKMEMEIIGDGDGDDDEERAKKKEGEKGEWRRCLNCGRQKTPQWRVGPEGPKTLCNACGVRFRKQLPLHGT